MYGCEEIPEEPKCHHSCQKIDDKYSAEKTYGGKPYRIPPIEEDIQIEILMNGPVEASFKVYADLALYKGNENVYFLFFVFSISKNNFKDLLGEAGGQKTNCIWILTARIIQFITILIFLLIFRRCLPTCYGPTSWKSCCQNYRMGG